MRLPFVSRERYEEVKMLYDQSRKDLTAFHEKYEALAALVIERGLQDEKVDAVPLEPPPKRERSIVELAIQDEAQGDDRLARYYATRAQHLRKEGHTDPEIAHMIRMWHTTEEVQ
jgi:hypothetical protein